jgi:hypothetical protein
LDTVTLSDAPLTAKFVPQVERDIKSMQRFTNLPSPIMVLLRLVLSALWLAYGFGDASEEGKGYAIQPMEEANEINMGFWCTLESEKSSNNREFRNLRNFITTKAMTDRFTGREVWIGTDNKAAVQVWHKGGSSERELYQMSLEVNECAIQFQFIVHLVHVAGTRLISIGIDGLSRGDLDLRKLNQTLYLHLPLDCHPIKRSPDLLNGLRSWITEDFNISLPEDWFTRAQQNYSPQASVLSDIWIWSLPPAAALDALEELGRGRLKRHYLLLGVIVIPAVLQPAWFRKFVKVTDLYFFIPSGAIPEWPLNMHEALTIGLYFPLLRLNPWDWSNVPFMGRLGGTLSALYRADPTNGGDPLRQFWAVRAWITTMPSGMVCSLLLAETWHKFLGVSRKRS